MNDKDEVRFTCVLKKDLYKQLKHYCIQNDVKLKEFINEAIKEKLEK